MINKIDFLSPPITLFHLERRTHTSKFGACLVILLVLIFITYTIYTLLNLINHKNITYIFHKKFDIEAGYYSFNSSSAFHFIQIFSPDKGGYFGKYDTKYIRAFMTYAYANISYGNLDLYDHWVFDNCRKNIDDKDLEPYLLENIENFTNGVCIRYYYNSTERKYYSLEDKSFQWPYLQHGISQKNNIYLTTIIQKCSNDSIINEILGQCLSQKEIDEYLMKYFAIYLYFKDTQVDPTNYTMPIQKYLQVITTSIGNQKTYAESFIYFSPLRIKTEMSSIFGTIHEFSSFYFDFSRNGAANNEGEKYFTISKYYHIIQNNVQIYERRYNSLMDIFSEIGGVVQFIFYLFYWINYAYNKFIIAYDTYSLFFSMKDEHSKIEENHFSSSKNEINIKGNDNTIFNIKNNIIKISNNKTKKIYSKFKPKNINSNKYNNLITDNNLDKSGNNEGGIILKQQIKSSNNINNRNNIVCLKSINYNNNLDLIKMIKPNNENNKYYLNQHNDSSNIIMKDNNNLNFNSYKKINTYNMPNKINYKLINIDKEKKVGKSKTLYVSNKNYIRSISISKRNIAKIEHIKKNLDLLYGKNIKKAKRLTFIDFIKSLFFHRDKGSHHFLTLFRKHLLSEEHLLKSHINMVLFEKKYNINEEEKTNIFECYNEL